MKKPPSKIGQSGKKFFSKVTFLSEDTDVLSYLQTEEHLIYRFMKSSFLPKYKQKIVRNLDNFLFGFWEKQ